MTSKLTITRARLIELFDYFGPIAMPGEVQELARMALSAMDGEPVAWVSSEALDSRLAGIEAVTIPFVPGMDIPLFRHPVVTHDGDCDADLFGFARRSGDLVVIDVNGDPHVRDGMPLYRHAQPAPVLPEEKPMPNPLSMHTVDAVVAIAEVKGWNDCRAAMLQTGNSPVIPDTWIPVSERMPEDGEHVIVFHPGDGVMQITFFFAYGKWWDAAEDDSGFAKSYFTHWMPLPIPPKEANHG